MSTLFKLVPSEEIPVIAGALDSGNQVLMDQAARDAIRILQIHKTDGENPNFRKLEPPLATVIKEFQALRPIFISHFNDPEPEVVGAVSKDDFNNTPWKTLVVQFMDLAGASPTSDMVTWMLKVVQWPNGRAQQFVARIEKDAVAPNLSPTLSSTHDAFLRTMMARFRSDALNVAPALSHLNPMPAHVLEVLTRKIDDAKEPQVAAEIIARLSENPSLGADIGDRLVRKALDTTAPVGVRVAAILAVGKMKPSDKPKLTGLLTDSEDKVAGAATDIGVRR